MKTYEQLLIRRDKIWKKVRAAPPMSPQEFKLRGDLCGANKDLERALQRKQELKAREREARKAAKAAHPQEPAPQEEPKLPRKPEFYTGSPEDACYDTEVRSHLFQTLSKVGPRHAKALRLNFGLDDGVEHNFRRVGAELGVSAERARQLVESALRTFRKSAALRAAAQPY